MGAAGHLRKMSFVLGDDPFKPDTWNIYLEGTITLEEIPTLCRLLEIYAGLAKPLVARPTANPDLEG